MKKSAELPQHKNPTYSNRISTAPYNFIPLPDKVIKAVEKDAETELPDQNRYYPDRRTGYFVVKLETLSPLYIRGLLTSEQFQRQEDKQYVDNGEQLPENPKDREFRRLAKNLPDFFSIEALKQPVIPGSSLRGMLRQWIEIITYSKATRVSDTHKIFYRAVAAPRDHPLKDAYARTIRGNESGVRAGYIIESGDDWQIKPAKTPQDIGLHSEKCFYSVKEHHVRLSKKALSTLTGSLSNRDIDLLQNSSDVVSVEFTSKVKLIEKIEDTIEREVRKDEKRAILKKCDKVYKIDFKLFGGALKRLDSGEYRPGHFPIGIVFEDNRPKLTDVSSPDCLRGVLVCSGNMLETEHKKTATPRTSHAFVPDEDPDAPELRISRQAVKDYLDALTPYMREHFGEKGVLKQNHPVFFVNPPKGQEVMFFGHSPNFRVPAIYAQPYEPKKRAAVPRDFVPEFLRQPEDIDFAESMFGFLRDEEELRNMQRRGVIPPKLGSKGRAYAGRVFVSDARLLNPTGDDLHEVVEPKILASPKPTAYAHYLVQGEKQNGEPRGDRKFSLAHYGSRSLDETVIRGTKLYWPKGNVDVSELKEDKDEHLENGSVKPKSTQHTRIKPVKAQREFEFRVYFENLADEELGALCWVLHPSGKEGVKYCHRLGMGKPFGLGSVKLDAKLFLTDRPTRYKSLFAKKRWEIGADREDGRLLPETRFVEKFEHHMLTELGAQSHTRFSDLGRIKMLLIMMAWQEEPNPQACYASVDWDYRELKVLPDPSAHDGVSGSTEPKENPNVGTTNPESLPGVAKPAGTKRTTQLEKSPDPQASVTLEAILEAQQKKKQAKSSVGFTGKKKELVTLLTDINGGKAEISLNGSEKPIVCKNFPYAPDIEAGSKCWAEVSYDKGAATTALFRKWD